MTKEIDEILEKYYKGDYDLIEVRKFFLIAHKQQLSAERERAGKLVQCAERLLFLHGCEQEGLSSGKPSFADWIHATNNLQNEIDRFKSTDPETTGNQENTNPSS